jgi:hypothetical protein
MVLIAVPSSAAVDGPHAYGETRPAMENVPPHMQGGLAQ